MIRESLHVSSHIFANIHCAFIKIVMSNNHCLALNNYLFTWIDITSYIIKPSTLR